MISVLSRSKKLKALLAESAVLAVLLVASWSVGFAQQPLQVMHSHVPSVVSTRKATELGSLSPDEHMHLSIVLPLRKQAELTSLLARLYDPSSPDYRHFLSVAEFTKRFGPTDADYQAVVAYARANGFEVDTAPANRMIVPISGTVEEINRALNVVMNSYQHPTENRTFFSPDREPSLNLAVPIAHISGLSNFSLPHPMLVVPQDSQQPSVVSGSGPGGSYLGSDMRAAYYGGTALNGSGQAVGLLEFTGYSLSDVNETFSNAGQSYTVPINNVLLDGASGAGSGGGEGEVVLDIVQAIGMAPGLSQVRVYIGSGSDDANILNSMASENVAKQLSCSWGWQPEDPGTDDVFFLEFAAQGQSFLTASGDSGAFDRAINPFFYPGEDAYVTAVGGTHLATNGAGGGWVSETAWNSQGHGSGGGISPDNIPIPSWQTGVANASNGGSTVLRNVPDVAMEGDFDNYACSNGACSGTYAGTSFAAPRWAGFMALVNQQAVEAGNAPLGGIGFINPAIYQIGSGTSYGNDLHDVASGNNDTGSQPIWYNSVTGYDLVTGWGSANGQSLIDDLAGPQVPGFWLISSASTIGVNQGTSSSTTITVSDAGGFSGDVTLSLPDTLPTGVTATWGTNPTSTSSLLTLTADSSAPVSSTSVAITGTSGTLTETTNVTVAVHGPTFVLSPSPNNLSVNQGTSGTSTVTVTPEYGFSGSVHLAVSGLPVGVTATWGTNPTSGSSVLTVTASSSAVAGTSTLTITGTSGSLTVTGTLILNIEGPSFTLTAYGPINIGQGSSSAATVFINGYYGFTGSVNLAVSGLPSGVTASFSPNPATGNSVLTLTASSSASVGSSTLTITGTSGALTASTTITLGVYAPSFTLYTSGSASVGQGSSTNSYVYVEPEYGFSGNVTFSISGLPSGVTALWNPNPASSESTLILAASSSAAAGQYTLTVTGTSGSVSATTTITLGVYVPTFTLSGPGSLSVGQGGSTSYYVYVNAQYGFSGSVNLVASGLPSGVTASFSPNPTTPGSTLMKLTAAGSVTASQSTVTITGTSGTQTASTTFTLGVYVPTFTLSGGAATIGQGTSGSTYVDVNPQYGFTGSVNLAASGLPSGVTASFSPNPTTGYSSLTLTASSSAAVGQYTLTITGTSGTQTATTTVTLGVYVPTFTLSSPGSLTVGQGASAGNYVYATPQYGFTGSVNFSVSGLPSGVTASFSPNPTTGNSLMTLTASSSAATGQYSVMLTGTSGTQTVSTIFSVSVYAPTFTLSAYAAVNVGQGSSGTSYVYVYPQYGFAGNVSLSVSGLPSGVTASFSQNPTPVAGGVYLASTLLTLTASSSASLGQYTVTITGTSGSQTTSTSLTVGVYAQSFTIYDSPGSVTLNQGSFNSSYVYITPQYGFAGNVTFAATGLPSGVTASFSPNPATGNTMLTLTASNTATSGPATVLITGTSDPLSAATSVNLTIYASTFSVAAAPGEVGLLPGASDTSTIAITPLNGFSGSVSLAVSGLPAGVIGNFSPSSTSGTSKLTLTASQSATPASATAIITGSSGTISVSTPLLVTVRSAPATTSTILAITAGGSPVTTVASNTAVNLTAIVNAGSAMLTIGQVNFCDAAGTTCDQVHLLGKAQLTSAGVAVLKFIPGPGSHSYKAVFAGTNTQSVSSSSTSALTVTALQTSATTIAQSGVAGNYSLTATVVGQGPFAPSGTVSFLDTTDANALAGTATLTPSPATAAWVNSQTPATGTQPSAVAVGDFNGDGKPDLAVTSEGSNSVTILLGKGDGTFAAGTSVPTGSQPISIVASDFNGDGKLDLAVVNNNGNSVTILLGNGDGTFTVSQLSPQTGSYPRAIVAGDFNGDGIPDLAVTNESSNSVTILLGNGDGTFTPTAQSPQTGFSPTFIAVGDFNNDGIQDLAVVNDGNTLSILIGNGDGTFSTGVTQTLGNAPQSIAVGDFNGDGFQDLAVAIDLNSTITIFLGNGDGTFTSAASSPSTGFDPLSVVVADLNGDGIQDLAVSSYNANTVTTLLGKGDGSFTAGPVLATGSEPYSIATGDFDGNGVPDLAVANYASNSVSILTARLTQSAKAIATGISPFGTGLHSVDASYAGDSSYEASISGSTQLTAELATPTLTATPSSFNVTTTEPLQVIVTLSGVSGLPTPSGNVTLISGTYSSTPAALSNSTVSITVPAYQLALGHDSLTVSYAGDANYRAINSGTGVTVATATPTVTVSPSAASFTVAQEISVTAMLSGGVGVPIPTGAVTLTSGSYTSAAITLSGGSAAIIIPAGALSLGTDTLNVAYVPDAPGSLIYNGASGGAAVSVTAAAPTIVFGVANQTYGNAAFSVSAISNSSGVIRYSVVSGPATISGSTVTLTGAGTVVLLASQDAAGGYLSGMQTTSFTTGPGTQSISFTAPFSPVLYGSAPVPLSASSSSGLAVTFRVVSGSASISGSSLTIMGAGAVVVAADQAGNANYAAASEVTRSVMVSNAAPAVGLTASPNPVLVQNAVTLTAMVYSATSTPTGSIVFSDSGTILGTVNMSAGTASLSIATLATGTHSITAVYSGDGNFSSVSSAVLSETVQDFSLTTGGSLSQTVPPGGTATFTLPLSPSGGTTFPAAVNFSASGLPAGFTATFSPSSLGAGSSATNVSLAIQVPLTAMLDRDAGAGRRLPLVALGLLILPFLGGISRSGKRLRCLTIIAVLAGACIATLVSGCGSGNGSGNSGSSTQPQNYVVTVNASSGMLSHSTTVSLTVQ